MRALYVNLLNTLNEEKDGYLAMLDLCGRLQEAVLQNDIAALESLVAQQRELWDRITGIDKQRERQSVALGRVLGIAESDLQLSVLIERASPDMQPQLWTAQEELEAVLQRQSWINEVNHRLMDIQLSYTSYMLNSLTANDPLNNTYTQYGVETVEQNSATVFNRHI